MARPLETSRMIALIVSVSLVLAACTSGTDTLGLDSDVRLVKGGTEVDAVLEGREPVEGLALADGDVEPAVGHVPGAGGAIDEIVDAAPSGFTEQIRSIGSAPTLADLATRSPVSGPAPRWLQLPGIGVVDAPVTGVGVEDNGDMEIPGADEVGWYQYGPTPGADGSAVLAAHIAFDGVDGVFRRLAEVKPGDELSVDYDDGTSRPFVVVGLRQYSKLDAPLDELFAREGIPRLILITCGGTFNRALNSYDDNIVVISVPLDFALGDSAGS